MINDFTKPNSYQQNLRKKRAARETRFRWYGRMGLALAATALAFLLFTIISNGYKGFLQAEMKLTIHANPSLLVEGATSLTPEQLQTARTQPLIKDALKMRFAKIEESLMLKLPALVSPMAQAEVKDALLGDPSRVGQSFDIWVTAGDAVDRCLKLGAACADDVSIKLNDDQKAWVRDLESKGEVELHFSSGFFTHGDSRSPERAGFLGAMAGSFFTLLTCMLVAFPLGVFSAIYLEEFAKKGKLTDIIEVNINNLAAVPSIVFGLLGLAIYLGVFGLPRSASLVGGMTLALMILPTLIITTRASLKSIPDSIRDAARALGASPMQVVFHHVVPLAMPGIMTGTILGMARAIGETAPLLMIGMVAFVADIPSSFTDAATVMPVQIYLWASSPEASFVQKTSAGIIVLLALLLCMNALAIVIRKKFEHRW